MSSTTKDATEASGRALADLDGAVCSDGAPSARNLLVTVFGDVVMPCGRATEATVQGLTAMLADFGVNERLVRTSLSRLVNDELLAVRSEGRRSFYRVAPAAVELFLSADARIYRAAPATWDGEWTLVVLDGAESTADHRALLRNELAALGLGSVAPNVMGSPLVPAGEVARSIARVGGFEHVVVTRGPLAAGPGLTDAGSLARRCLDLDGLEAAYADLAERLEAFGDAARGLDDARALKLRLLVVSTFRRLALIDPTLPVELLPADWSGRRARRVAGRLYRLVAAGSDRRVREVAGLAIATPPSRFG